MLAVLLVLPRVLWLLLVQVQGATRDDVDGVIDTFLIMRGVALLIELAAVILLVSLADQDRSDEQVRALRRWTVSTHLVRLGSALVRWELLDAVAGAGVFVIAVAVPSFVADLFLGLWLRALLARHGRRALLVPVVVVVFVFSLLTYVTVMPLTMLGGLVMAIVTVVELLRVRQALAGDALPA